MAVWYGPRPAAPTTSFTSRTSSRKRRVCREEGPKSFLAPHSPRPEVRPSSLLSAFLRASGYTPRRSRRDSHSRLLPFLRTLSSDAGGRRRRRRSRRVRDPRRRAKNVRAGYWVSLATPSSFLPFPFTSKRSGPREQGARASGRASGHEAVGERALSLELSLPPLLFASPWYDAASSSALACAPFSGRKFCIFIELPAADGDDGDDGDEEGS